MVSAKLRSVAQVFGFLCMAFLTLYGALALFGGGALPSFARSASAAAVPGEAPKAVPNGAPSLDWGGATVPLVLNYQGYLRDAEHNPLSGYYTMTLRVYANVTDPVASALWSEEHISVTVRSGSFSVLLGNITPVAATLFNTPDRFIGVMVEPYDEMVPRQRFASVPYAISANDGVPTGAIIIWTGTDGKCPSGYTRVSALDNRFLSGAATYGATGGAATHTHSVSTGAAGEHTHTIATQADHDHVNVGDGHYCGQGGNKCWAKEDIAWWAGGHNHGGATGSAGSHTHTGTAAASSNIPPYTTVVFCKRD